MDTLSYIYFLILFTGYCIAAAIPATISLVIRRRRITSLYIHLALASLSFVASIPLYQGAFAAHEGILGNTCILMAASIPLVTSLIAFYRCRTKHT